MKRLFITPPSTSEDRQCRVIRQPTDLEWLANFNNALLQMLDPWNWEQVNDTDITVDEAIAVVEGIVAEYFATETCATGCTLPGLDGTPPFRLGISGHFEMLDPVTGEWTEPSGEYAIPPTPAREESTTDERKCLAAANAAYVVGLVYEAITDEIALGGDQAQIVAAMVAALVTAVGGWIAAPVYAIIQLTIALIAGMIELLQVLGADVWTEGYQEHLQCVLYACATDTDDVVTFDLTCIRENLYEGLDLLDPDFFYDAQIYAQVLFLIETIGLDGLNAAGATTAITEADCGCGEWCYTWDFTETDGGFAAASLDFGTPAVYVAGVGWQTQVTSAGSIDSRGVCIARDFAGLAVTQIGAVFTDPTAGNLTGAPANSFCILLLNEDATLERINNPVGSPTLSHVAEMTIDEIKLLGRSGYCTNNCGDPGGQITITRFTLFGVGENPFGSNNC